MDFLPNQEALAYWLLNYGSISLFILLALGVVALPVPDETLMVLAGIFMKNGDLPISSTLFASFLGCMTGITLSYVIGRTAGTRIIHKYGANLGLTEEKMQNIHNWFQKYGKWTLTFGYFIPGVRHFTGFAAGTSDLEYHKFAAFAYLGAAIWTSVFLSIGYFVGHYWHDFISVIENSLDYSIIGIISVVALIFYVLKKKNFFSNSL